MFYFFITLYLRNSYILLQHLTKIKIEYIWSKCHVIKDEGQMFVPLSLPFPHLKYIQYYTFRPFLKYRKYYTKLIESTSCILRTSLVGNQSYFYNTNMTNLPFHNWI